MNYQSRNTYWKLGSRRFSRICENQPCNNHRTTQYIVLANKIRFPKFREDKGGGRTRRTLKEMAAFILIIRTDLFDYRKTTISEAKRAANGVQEVKYTI